MKRVYIFLSIFTLFLAACDDSFLDRYPRTEFAPESFFNSEEDLAMYVYGLHSVSSVYQYQGDQGTDNMATTAVVEIKNIMTGNPTSENISGGWNWAYLRDINFFLENYHKASLDAPTQNHYEGVAKYYRAQFYYNKIKRFSDVPWYSQTLGTTDEDLYKPRDPRTLVVDSIFADLDFAVHHTRDKANVPEGAIHKWAALMLQARIALHEGTYRKYHAELGLQNTANTYLEIARNAALEIISSGEFAISMEGGTEEAYRNLFNSTSLSGNTEAILVHYYDYEKEKSSNINFTVFGDYEQSPSRDLVMNYLMQDGNRFTEQPAHESLTFVEEFQNRDPRLKQTLVYPGWVQAPNDNAYVQRLNKNFTGYHQLKGYINSTENSILQSMDVPVYRFAEALLIYAEAKAELGELTQADLDMSVNQLRDRAGMPHLLMAEANANPDPFLTSKYPNVSGSNQGVLLEIRRERRIEFALEGFRFDDLMRWNAGKLLENKPEGMYFPGLGKYDMTGDGIEDIILIGKDQDIPDLEDKEKNSLGEVLVYYKAGLLGEEVTVYLQNGESGGNIITQNTERIFTEPRDYYRPIPAHEVLLNPQLEQLFGWQ
ncbi:RagB/SusD family nutrient uptake outer membrane protein [Rapidithrix thailandica]|uniref:RagB/SusD family nutrient uptake outer membrane protein n=1 Tax=Rapidithrix thailandica TaxID=413964 RepID=A0AAW9S796_9BACT